MLPRYCCDITQGARHKFVTYIVSETNTENTWCEKKTHMALHLTPPDMGFPFYTMNLSVSDR